MTLRVPGAVASGEVHEVLIHNLSETGLLLETVAELSRGQELLIELPDVPAHSARVVWNSDGMYGCEFDTPISTAAVSAAQLRSAPGSREDEPLQSAPSTPPFIDAVAFGARLRTFRKTKGLSLVEFARRAKVSRPTVWSWEAGKTYPRQSKFPDLLDVLGIGEAELLGTGTSQAAEISESDPPAATELRNVVGEAKIRVAEAAGTTPDKVKLVIEI